MFADTRPIILFDVDKTLINTGLLFRELIVVELQKILNLSWEVYQQRDDAYQQSLEKYTDFEPLGYLQAISQQNDVSELAAQTIFNPHFHQQAVFSDAVPCLTNLATDYQLGIFSEANFDWQKQKLHLSGLDQHFIPELVFILRRKTDPAQLQQLPKPVIIIDDNPEVIAELKKVSAISPIWLNRVGAPPMTNVTTITSLNELTSVLANQGNHG